MESNEKSLRRIKGPSPEAPGLTRDRTDVGAGCGAGCGAGYVGHVGCGKRDGRGGRNGTQRACKLFTVAEGVKRLDEAQLAALSAAFDAWTAAARDERARASRERVRLVFLLLRFTGARLGEVLSLDEQEDFEFERSLVFFSDDRGGRETALPEFLTGEVRELAERLAGSELAGRAFHLDQGFVRRKFHEQAPRCGLPKELLNPRVLRNSRAIEMLRGGAPLKAVQAMLGHASANQTSSFVTYREEDLRHIIHSYIQNESKTRTSARNAFVGEVCAVKRGTILSEATIRTDSGKEVVSVITNESLENLGVAPGKTLAASVKAPLVMLSTRDGLGATGARNCYPGLITRIHQGEIVAEVMGDLDDGTPMCALATRESVTSMGLAEGGRVWFLCSAFSVILNAP